VVQEGLEQVIDALDATAGMTGGIQDTHFSSLCNSWSKSSRDIVSCVTAGRALLGRPRGAVSKPGTARLPKA
jgi:hypothetical protein